MSLCPYRPHCPACLWLGNRWSRTSQGPGQVSGTPSWLLPSSPRNGSYGKLTPVSKCLEIVFFKSKHNFVSYEEGFLKKLNLSLQVLLSGHLPFFQKSNYQVFVALSFWLKNLFIFWPNTQDDGRIFWVITFASHSSDVRVCLSTTSFGKSLSFDRYPSPYQVWSLIQFCTVGFSIFTIKDIKDPCKRFFFTNTQERFRMQREVEGPWR